MANRRYRSVSNRVLRVGTALLSIVLTFPGTAFAGDPLPVAEGHATPEPGSSGVVTAAQSTSQFAVGDVFIGVGNGQIQWRLPDGTLNATLDTGLGGFTTGMAFDKLGNLYSTAFTANNIVKFDTSGTKIGTFGSSYNSRPESIAINAAGDFYVGQADGSRDVIHLSGTGALIGTHDVGLDRRGSDWVDLSSDQCTLYYTSEGTRIKRFDVCANTQLPDLTALLQESYALRLLPGVFGDRAILVADTSSIKMVDAVSGGISNTYDAPGQDCWFALNLDPDGTSFWSADFCTSMVFKFDISSGAVLSQFNTGTPSSTVFGLIVNGEFADARNRSCESENISLGQVGADTDQVSVRYDPRFLVDESKSTSSSEAQAMMTRLRDRAVATYAEYRDQLGFTLPDHVRIEIRCEIIAFRGVPLLATHINAPGFTESDTLVQLQADSVRTDMLDPTNTSPNATWKTLVDHELYHTIWVKGLQGFIPNQVDGFFRYRLLGDPTNSESEAMLGQDLIAESDDAPALGASYLESVGQWIGEPKTVEAGPDDPVKYQAAGFIQYLAERFGAGAALEPRVAAFLRSSYNDKNGLTALGVAMGTGDKRDPVIGALRDYYISALVHRAPNVNSTQNPSYRYLDETTPHNGTTGTPPLYPVLQVPGLVGSPLAAATFNGQTLNKAAGRVYLIDTLGGASTVRVTVTTPQGRFMNFSRPKLAFVPLAADNSVSIDPSFMPDAPSAGSMSWVVPVAGQNRLAVVVVTDGSAKYSLKVEDAGGTSALELQKPTAANPAPAIESACPKPYITATVRPTINGTFATGRPKVAFTATIDGAGVPISHAYELTDNYVVVLKPAVKPAVGTHTIRVSFNGVIAPQIGQITVVSTTTCSTEQDRSIRGAMGPLGQGQQATTTAPVAAGDVSASFSLAWAGSDFDLRLTSPGGRAITEATIAPDVHVVQAPTSVKITVDAPQAGSWQLQATAASVPAPESVTYDIVETGTAVRSDLVATNTGGAGAPIVARLSMTDDSIGITKLAAEATVTDPIGQVRHFPLFDDGAHGDSSPNDGTYGAFVWATDRSGGYHLEVTANGNRPSDGSPIARQESADLTLGAKVDTDGDRVADAAESLLGTSPTTASDGSVDWDGDGVGLADELIAGTDIDSWDSDRGGENDQSELAANRDPRRATDDRAFPQLWLSTQARDGNTASIAVATSDGSGQIRVYRVDDASRTDLGLKAGTGTTFVDGPVASGTYRYVAVIVAADGSQSAPVAGPLLTFATDVTPPFVRMAANDGVWATTSPIVRLTFTDLSEPVTSMRIAESLTGLQAASWISYANPTTFTIGSTDGRHFVYGQVRDAAGNASNIASAIVDLASGAAAWAPSVKVNNDTGTSQQDRAAIALGPDGATYLIWDDYRPGTQADIYFSRRDPATGAWSANQKVNNDTTTRTQWNADIAVDGSNNAYAVWQDPRNGNKTPDDDIYFSKRSASTGSWSANVRVNNDTQGAPLQVTPRIGVKADGAAVAVWVDRRSNQWSIYSARLAAGGTTWGANIRVTTNTSSRKNYPDVTVGPDGTAYAVWEDDRQAGNYDVWYSKLPPGSSTWTPEVKVSDDPATRAQYGARIGIDAAGNLVVAWLDDRPYPRTEVRVSRLAAGSSTWTSSAVVSDAPAYAVALDLAVKGNGNAFAAWQDARGSSYDIWGSYFTASPAGWSVPALVSDDPGATAQMRPTVAINNTEIEAAWTDIRSGNPDIFARRRTPS